MILFIALLCVHVSAALPQKKPFIVGGIEATYGDFPYICSLQNFVEKVWLHKCGSVIWNENHLITAAHCLGDSARSHQVVCGNHHLHEADEYQVTLSVFSYVMHPNYNGTSQGYPNDIAVLKLSSPLTFNSHVNKITFAPADSGNFEGESCVLSGWGLLSGDGPRSETLQRVNLTVISNTECQDIFPDFAHDGNICYMTQEGESGCNSDSGGPAVCGNILTGITSWGMKTCNGYYPSVYTRVSTYYHWLVSQAGSN